MLYIFPEKGYCSNEHIQWQAHTCFSANWNEKSQNVNINHSASLYALNLYFDFSPAFLALYFNRIFSEHLNLKMKIQIKCFLSIDLYFQPKQILPVGIKICSPMKTTFLNNIKTFSYCHAMKKANYNWCHHREINVFLFSFKN